MSTTSKAAASGFIWSSLSQAVRVGSQILGVIILARLLPPSDFGVISLASVVTGVALLFRDFGTTAAVIQRQELTPHLLDSVFIFNVSIGIGLAVLLGLVSPIAAHLFSEPRLRDVLWLLTLSFPVSALGFVHQALMERVSNFKPVALVESSAAVLGVGAAVGAAWSGLGVYSLVVQALTSAIITTIGLWCVSEWRPGRNGSLAEIKGLQSFSGNLVGFNIFNYFARNADNILIGLYLGTRELGYYTMAYRLMLWPLLNITAVVARSLFPLFSRMQADKSQMANAYLMVTASIALISSPLMCGLFVLREPFVRAVLGSQWLQVADLLMWLAPVGLFQSVGATVGILYLATGRTDLMFRWGIFASTVIVFAFTVGIQWGLQGLVISYALAMCMLFLPLLMIPLRLVDLSVSRFLINLLPAVMTSFAMALIVALANEIWGDRIHSVASRLSALVVLGILSYAILSYLFQKRILRDLFLIFRPKM